MAPRFAVEEGGNTAQYHRIHTEGCRDLKDPESLGTAYSWGGLHAAAVALYGDEYETVADVRKASAPCVEKALRPATNTQPEDGDGNLIVRNARITHYLGSSDGTHRYVLELPETEWHQTGPYEMRKMR